MPCLTFLALLGLLLISGIAAHVCWSATYSPLVTFVVHTLNPFAWIMSYWSEGCKAILTAGSQHLKVTTGSPIESTSRAPADSVCYPNGRHD